MIDDVNKELIELLAAAARKLGPTPEGMACITAQHVIASYSRKEFLAELGAGPGNGRG